MRTSIVALLLIVTANASAQNEITPLVGWQTGGSVDVSNLGTPINDAPAFGAMLSFGRGPGRMLDLVIIGQSSRAERNDPFVPPASADVSVTYFQIGGRYVVHPEQRTRPYVAATVGGTYVTAGSADALQPSGALGAGVDLQLTPKVAIRFDGRFHATLFTWAARIQCDSSGTCAGSANGSGFTQFTASTGIVFRF